MIEGALGVWGEIIELLGVGSMEGKVAPKGLGAIGIIGRWMLGVHPLGAANEFEFHKNRVVRAWGNASTEMRKASNAWTAHLCRVPFSDLPGRCSGRAAVARNAGRSYENEQFGAFPPGCICVLSSLANLDPARNETRHRLNETC